MAPPNTPIPKVERVEAHGARPEAADLRKIQHYGQTRGARLPEVTTLYKLYVRDLPPASGRALELFVGDHQVRKYSEFSGGIFFTVNDPDLADRLGGGRIRFRYEGTEEMIESGVILPPRSVTDDKVPKEALPSQRELLQK